MDSMEFLINFFASLKINGVSKVSHDTLKIFLNSYDRNVEFRKIFQGVELDNIIESNIEILLSLNIVKRKGIRRDKYLILLNDKVSYEILSSLSDEELTNIFLYTIRCKSFMHKMDELANLSYEETYGIIDESFIKNSLKENLNLVKSHKRK